MNKSMKIGCLLSIGLIFLFIFIGQMSSTGVKKPRRKLTVDIKEKSFKSFNGNDVWVCSITSYDSMAMVKWGKKWSNPTSSVVIHYFFLDSLEMPDIRYTSSFEGAKKTSLNKQPIAAYWKYANGKTALFDMR